MKKWAIGLGAAMILVGVVVGVLVKVNLDTSKTGSKFPDRGVPVMNIELEGVSLEEIKDGGREKEYPNNELSLYEDGKIINYDGVEIKGRGNSTWWKPKKPYQIGFGKNVDLLGFGRAKKWVLWANYYDASLIRNDVALILAEMLEEKYSFRGGFVELYFNGEYEGLYYLVKKIEIAKGSVDLKNDDGILFELDSLHRDRESCYESYLGDCLVLKDVVSRDSGAKSAIASDFLADFNKVEMAAEQGDYATVEEVFDIESFVEYFLVNEFTVNPDAYSSSFYLYRDNDGKISAGPVWDFDFALANYEWGWQLEEKFYSPYESMIRRVEAFGEEGLDEDPNISKLFYYLMEIPEFKEEVSRVFQKKLSGRKDEFVKKIMDKAEEIGKAAIIDGKKWERDDFGAEVERIIEWIEARYDYFEEIYGSEASSVKMI